MGSQQTAFPVLSVSSEEQEVLAQSLNVLTTILNFGVIEIEQKNPRTRELQVVMVVNYTEIQDDDDLMVMDTMGGETTPADHYPHQIEGGGLKFVKNPYMRAAMGTGNVAFLVDDNEPTPKGALSGATHGWNREFLASHFEDGFWVIVDDVIREEIRGRWESIKVALKDKRIPLSVAGPVPENDADMGRVPVEGEGVSPEEYLANREGQIAAAPQMNMGGPGPGAERQKPRRTDGLPSQVTVTPQQDQRIDKLEERMVGVESGIQDILAAVTMKDPVPPLTGEGVDGSTEDTQGDLKESAEKPEEKSDTVKPKKSTKGSGKTKADKSKGKGSEKVEGGIAG